MFKVLNVIVGNWSEESGQKPQKVTGMSRV